MVTRASIVALALLVVPAAPLPALPSSEQAEAGKGELVLIRTETKQYHRPSCPLVRGANTKGVTAMTRGQAESRGYAAHPDCDPENPKAPAPKAPAPEAVTVFVDGSKYYHRDRTCERIQDADGVKAVSLEVAGKKEWPCPECRPAVRRKSTENAVPGTKRGGR